MYSEDVNKHFLQPCGRSKVNWHKGEPNPDSCFFEVFLVDSAPYLSCHLLQSPSTWSKRELLAFELLNHLGEGLYPSNDQNALVY